MSAGANESSRERRKREKETSAPGASVISRVSLMENIFSASSLLALAWSSFTKLIY